MKLVTILNEKGRAGQTRLVLRVTGEAVSVVFERDDCANRICVSRERNMKVQR